MSAKKILGTILGIGLIAVGVLTGNPLLIELGASVAIGSILSPGKPKIDLTGTQTNRLTATLVPTEPRKISFGGPTALGNDVRYQAFTGTNQEYLEMIVAHAGHAVHSIDELWLDNEIAWNGTVQGRYVGYLTVTPITEGTRVNGIAIDSNWTVNTTLTGCAYSHIKAKLTGNSDKVSSPFSSGVTSRMTWRGKGAKVYDPRLDSTVAGGSGSQRANDQTTWTWDDNASRNPALQELFYELGWKINSKLSVGKGVPPARLDLASYAVAANHCDESVTLAAGGTEPRYRSDGNVSEGDDPKAVRDNLCSTMNAVLRDAGGKMALTVIVNDLATPVTPSGKVAFDADDILGDITWNQTPDLNSTFNIVRGQRIDPSDAALYQPVDYPEVSLASTDGIDRIDTTNFPFVQSNGQSQRLAKQRLERNQYQGQLTFSGKPSFWGVNLGDVFPLTLPTFGWSAKLFRCAGQKISRTGQTDMVAVEENAAIYAWVHEESPAVTAGAPVVYNPLNDPFVLGMGDAGNSAAPGDSNRVRNSKFEQGTAGWGYLLVGGGTFVNDFIARDAVSDRVALQWTATAAGQYGILLNDAVLSGALPYRIPVTPGERIFVGGLLEAGGAGVGSWQLTANFKDNSNAAISAVNVASGTGSISPQFVTYGGFATVPAGAVYLSLEYYVFSGGAGSVVGSLGKPIVMGAGTAQVTWPAFSPGPSGEPGAQVTRWVDGPPQSTTFNYDYTGSALTGEFSRDLGFKLYDSNGQITSAITWTYVVTSGTVNGFTSASGAQSMSGSGTGTLTVSSLGSATVSVKVTASYAGQAYSKTADFAQSVAAPPVSGGGGGGGGGGSTTLASQSSGFGTFNSTTFTSVTGASLTGVVVPSGVSTVHLNANLTITPATTGGVHTWTDEGKWQVKVAGVWTDVDTSPASTITSVDGGGGDPLNANSGSLVDSQTYSVSAGTYDFQYVARETSGTRTHYVSGTASITT